MDPRHLKQAIIRLQALDDRLTHKIRPSSRTTMTRPSTERLEEELRHLAQYSVELKEIVQLMLAGITNQPPADSPGG
ncbi:MAG: hypothetical protein AAF604_17080 [Acidobacteriota bacterium]